MLKKNMLAISWENIVPSFSFSFLLVEKNHSFHLPLFHFHHYFLQPLAFLPGIEKHQGVSHIELNQKYVFIHYKSGNKLPLGSLGPLQNPSFSFSSFSFSSTKNHQNSYHHLFWANTITYNMALVNSQCSLAMRRVDIYIYHILVPLSGR